MNPLPKPRLSFSRASIHAQQQRPEQEYHLAKIQRHHSLFEKQARTIDLPLPPHNNGSHKQAAGSDHRHHSSHHYHRQNKSFKSDPSPTKSIPIQDNNRSLKRTGSELRLQEQEEIADFRDYVFFTRLVEGIARFSTNNETTSSDWLQRQNDACLAHIIGTRNGSVDQLQYDCTSETSPYNYAASQASSFTRATSSLSSDEIFVMDW